MCVCVRVRNVVCYKTGRTQTEGIREYGVEEDIWVQVRAGSSKLHNVEFQRFVPLTKYYSGDHIKKNEIGRECGTCGG
jgi:hypothetical protein